jgi:hypothetical protein
VSGVDEDQTDHELKAYGVAASKQICDKPIGSQSWRIAASASSAAPPR